MRMVSRWSLVVIGLLASCAGVGWAQIDGDHNDKADGKGIEKPMVELVCPLFEHYDKKQAGWLMPWYEPVAAQPKEQWPWLVFSVKRPRDCAPWAGKVKLRLKGPIRARVYAAGYQEVLAQPADEWVFDAGQMPVVFGLLGATPSQLMRDSSLTAEAVPDAPIPLPDGVKARLTDEATLTVVGAHQLGVRGDGYPSPENDKRDNYLRDWVQPLGRRDDYPSGTGLLGGFGYEQWAIVEPKDFRYNEWEVYVSRSVEQAAWYRGPNDNADQLAGEQFAQMGWNDLLPANDDVPGHDQSKKPTHTWDSVTPCLDHGHVFGVDVPGYAPPEEGAEETVLRRTRVNFRVALVLRQTSLNAYCRVSPYYLFSTPYSFWYRRENYGLFLTQEGTYNAAGDNGLTQDANTPLTIDLVKPPQ